MSSTRVPQFQNFSPPRAATWRRVTGLSQDEVTRHPKTPDAPIRRYVMNGYYRRTPNVMGEIDWQVIATAVETIVDVIHDLFGGESGDSMWTNQDVHDWFHYYGEQSFQDWVKQNHPSGFGNMDSILGLVCLWMKTKLGQIVRPDERDGVANGAQVKHWYKGGITETTYLLMGIDYAKTLRTCPELGKPNFRTPREWIFVPTNTPVTPQPPINSNTGGGGNTGGEDNEHGGGGGKPPAPPAEESSSMLLPALGLLIALANK